MQRNVRRRYILVIVQECQRDEIGTRNVALLTVAQLSII
jgi:hypothetical protein